MSEKACYRGKRKTDSRLPLNHPDFALAEAQLGALQPFIDRTWGTILDFGAGNTPYRPLFRYGRYVAADVEQNATGTIDLLLDADTGNIPIENGSCDLVLCMDVLEHVPDDGTVLGECLRVLRPGGIFIAGIPFLYREHETPADFRRYTADGIVRTLDRAGFEQVEVRKMGNRWLTLYNILYESAIESGEVVPVGIFRIWFFRFFNRLVLPVLNRTLFTRPPGDRASTYARLLVSAARPGVDDQTEEKRES